MLSTGDSLLCTPFLCNFSTKDRERKSASFRSTKDIKFEQICRLKSLRAGAKYENNTFPMQLNMLLFQCTSPTEWQKICLIIWFDKSHVRLEMNIFRSSLRLFCVLMNGLLQLMEFEFDEAGKTDGRPRCCNALATKASQTTPSFCILEKKVEKKRYITKSTFLLLNSNMG